MEGVEVYGDVESDPCKENCERLYTKENRYNGAKSGHDDEDRIGQYLIGKCEERIRPIETSLKKNKLKRQRQY